MFIWIMYIGNSYRGNTYMGNVMEQRICKKCLLRDMELEDKAMISNYVDKIKPQDRVSSNEYEARLEVCKGCDYLSEGTCEACGCYVEFRAISIRGKCPYSKW